MMATSSASRSAPVEALSGRAAAGAAWLIGSRLITRGIDFLSMILLARLLSPADFGLVGVAMTVILMIEAVMEIPVNQVLVQLRTPSGDQINTAFTLGVMRASSLAVVVVALAVPFAWLYHDPRLAPVTLCLGLAPMMRGLQSPNMSRYAQKIDFRRDMLIEVSGKLIGLIGAVWAAHDGWGYWALIANTVANPIMMVIMSYVLAPYMPRLGLREWRSFAHFLGWTSAAQAVGAVSWQCDRLILANFVGMRSLGEFSLANDLSYLPEQALIKPIGRPLMSAFSLVQDEPERLKQAYLRAAEAIFALGMALMIGLSLLADPAVRFALGAKWIPAVPILTWLALSLIPPLAYAPVQALAMAVRRTDTFLYRSAVELVLKLPILFSASYLFGVMGMVVGRLIIAIIMAAVSLQFVRKLIGPPVLGQIKRMWRTLAGGANLAITLFYLRKMLVSLDGFKLGIGLSIVMLVGFIVYCSTLGILWACAGRPLDSPEGLVWRSVTRLFIKRRSSRSQKARL
jgi:O-antigen/teichoic acid export membrane protein